MSDTHPFDTDLYDAVMADKMDHALGVPSLTTEYSDGYDSGYHHAALTAARLAAERAGAVSDEERARVARLRRLAMYAPGVQGNAMSSEEREAVRYCERFGDLDPTGDDHE